MRDRDARRICGFTPLYLLAALMQAEARQGELLRYTQWVDTRPELQRDLRQRRLSLKPSAASSALSSLYGYCY